MIENYHPDAFDKVEFELIQEIVTKIITNNISTSELIQRGNVFSEHEKQALHNVIFPKNSYRNKCSF
jgi:hypothetical protein